MHRGRRAVLGGVVPGAKALFLLHLHADLGRPFVVVTPDEARTAALVHHLRSLAALVQPEVAGRVFPFPDLGASPYTVVAPHFQAMAERVAALMALHDRHPALVVAPAAALLDPLPHPDDFARMPVVLRPGDRPDPAELVRKLDSLGYTRVDLVGQAGEFARRGGVIDVYPSGNDHPRRLELLGDEVESIRRFDPETQRSSDAVPQLQIPPVREFGWTAEQREGLARRIEGRPGPRRRIAEITEALRDRGAYPGMEACAGLVATARFDLWDHAGEAVFVADEPFLSRAALDGALASREAEHEASEQIFPPPDELCNPVDPLREHLAASPLGLAELAAEESAADVIQISSAPVRNYRGRFPELATDLRRVARRQGQALLLVRGAGRADRIREILAGYDVPLRDADAPGDEHPGPGIYLGHSPLEGGFELRSRGLLLLTEHEIFGEEIRHRPARKTRLAAFSSDFRDLKPGDLVVHVDHGIGRFEGMQRVGDGQVEMMIVSYKGGDRLFVPLDRLDLVQKYSGVKGGAPVLDRLGGTAWQKTRKKVGKAVRDMTSELLELYARRKAARGHAYTPDTEWQREMEDAFEYTETPDQLTAIAEIKGDMESERPMDRLLCGDVGFGKTEVAMRAAFKAVQDGKQVAVLAPTTVLAFQHLRTFRERMASFPVRVEMVSRFVPRKERKKVLEATSTGQVDILVGTHRLLSRDVKFHALGLLVVDEEQRFGVTHKERLKKLRTNVDVLSLSATPIPRTLQMSLAGVRDMSVIETPPENRLAIQTSLVPFREAVITAAVRQELQREGQVYFVHNRIESIHSMANLVQRLVPECRPVVAHGQMSEGALESTMLAFLRNEFNVLVSTTIIENGLDMPRVNTLLVNRADRFGLAQLYQLRGRIGRSDRKAYAYLLVPSGGVQHPLARRRLAALQEFSDLGSGFRIAALDLELRGAGNLLGAQQHGHIAAIGFELYVQMLERAVREMAGEEHREEVRTAVNLGVDIRIPESFIEESNQRLMFYKRIAGAEDEAGLAGVREEMQDRFGHLPPQGDNLFRLASVRLLAQELRVRSVDHAEGSIQIKFEQDSTVDPDRLVHLLGARPDASLTAAGVLRVRHEGGPLERLEAAAELLKGLR
ncbi:MAG: transcription-repair coupling factor [Acidobacteriota bacterium]